MRLVRSGNLASMNRLLSEAQRGGADLPRARSHGRTAHLLRSYIEYAALEPNL